MDRLAPTRRPDRPAAGYQKWRSLLFLHWALPVETVARLLPPGLEVDAWEGRAWVGLVPFTMRDVRPRFLPAVSWVSDFDELNLRTYVHVGGRDPGVWFFSLEAAKGIPVRIARAHWHLPYHRADMELARTGDEVRYRSERRWPGPLPASFSAHWKIGLERGPAKPDTFEHFLAERYLLYAQTPSGLRVGQVHHTPYPLRTAEVREWREELLRPAGLPPAQGAPHALFSEGVDVEVFALRPVAG
jgi:uncharacterized protein YqjF (DUF2071 family)